jgi:serine/threonine protein kinase
MSGGKALRLFSDCLTEYERTEILDYNQIYFLGLDAKKITGSSQERFNNGYDNEQGNYKVVRRDHIEYRYEVLEMLGKGSFGQVVKCHDHKNNEEVAIKIINNKKEFYQQAVVEAKMLRYIKLNDYEDKANVVTFYECFMFRHHFVYINCNIIVLEV